MKKLLPVISLALLMVSCADEKRIDGVTYRPYGLINEGECKNDSIRYEIAIDAAISGVVFSEMLFIPTIYTYGFNLWEPKGKKNDNHIKGSI
jgi:hypothetical protein